MKKIIYSKPLRMPDDMPSRTNDSIRLTEENNKITSVEKFNGNKFEPLEIESLSSIDPIPKEVSYTENGEYSVKPEEYDGLSEVRVTVDVPAPSGGNVLVLKRNDTTIPQRDEGDPMYGPPSSFPIPFNLIESNDCNSIYCYTIKAEKTDMDYYYSPEIYTGLKALPFTVSYKKDYMGYTTDNYYNIVIFGTDTPGATLTVDTRYFDIVSLPEGFSADFSIVGPNLVTAHINGVSTQVDANKTWSNNGYNTLYTQSTYDPGYDEQPEDFEIDTSTVCPKSGDSVYTTCVNEWGE